VKGGPGRDLYEVSGHSLFNVRVSPDGRTVAVIEGSIIGNSRYQLVLVDVETGEARKITPPGFTLGCLAWVPGKERFVLARAGSVMGDAAGVPGRVFLLDGASGREQTLFWASGLFPLSGVGRRYGTCDPLDDGRLVFDQMQFRMNLREIELEGRDSAPRILTRGSSSDRQPSYAPSGERIVFSSNRSGNMDLWTVDEKTGALRQLTDDPAQDWDPGFTPDGRHLIWSSDRSGNLEIWIAASDGTSPRQLTHDGSTAENPTATPDGQWIVHASGHPEKVGIWKIRVDGSDATRLVPGSNLVPEVSPDGRYVLYITDARPNRRELRVVELETGEPVPFSIEVEWSQGVSSQILWGRARWIPDGKRIVFVGADEHDRSGVFIQDFVPGRDTRSTRRPLAGFSTEYLTESLGVSPDGRRLTIATLHQTSGLVLAEGLPGVAPPSTNGRR